MAWEACDMMTYLNKICKYTVGTVVNEVTISDARFRMASRLIGKMAF